MPSIHPGIVGALFLALVIGFNLHEQWHDARRRSLEAALKACASRTGLRALRDTPAGVSDIEGDFAGMRVRARAWQRWIELEARVRLGEPELRIIPRRMQGGPRPREAGRIGSPVIDGLASVRGASPALLARLTDSDNAQAILPMLHGYPEWLIATSGAETSIIVRLRPPVNEHLLERALVAVAALARALRGESG